MRLSSSPLTLAVLTAALAVVIGGCTGGHVAPVTDGPLSSGNGIHDPVPRGENCVPGGRSWAFGLQQFTNYGQTTVELDGVVLLHPHNETPGRLVRCQER